MIRRNPDKEQMRNRRRTLLALSVCLFWSAIGLPPSAFAVLPSTTEGYLSADDGVRLFYTTVGNGPETLVMVHGGPGNSLESLLPDMGPLAENHTVIYYDQRGNGRSELLDDPRQLTIDKHVQDLEAVRRHFQLDKMSLLGNSWGGLLAGFYAIAHPERVERLILHSPASPSFRLLSDSTGYIYQRIPDAQKKKFNAISYPEQWINSRDPRKLCREFYDILKPVYFSDPGKAAAMKGDTCAGPEEAIRRQQLVNKQIWVSLGDWDIQPALREMHFPALVIHGRDDMIPVDSSLAWAAAMPDARLLIIDSGHMTHIEQPDVFFPAVRRFLAGEWPQEAETVRERGPGFPGIFNSTTTGEVPLFPHLPPSP